MVEGARLESVYTGNGIAGSNPALSASPAEYGGAFFMLNFNILHQVLIPAVTLLRVCDYESEKLK